MTKQPGKLFPSAEFQSLLASTSQIRPIIEWLRANGVDPAEVIVAAFRRLRRGNRHLRPQARDRYAQTVVLGQFLALWARKHRGKRVRDFLNDDGRNELRTFELALILTADDVAFRRTTPKFVRKRILERSGMRFGTADDFSAFVAESSLPLADRFLSNFNPSSRSAPITAVNYLRKAAVSHFLVRRHQSVDDDMPGIVAYLQKSKLSERSRLAIKLAYMPALLTHEERNILQGRYGLTRTPAQRMKVKNVAAQLDYKSAAVLSRKLYRVRQWCDSWTRQGGESR